VTGRAPLLFTTSTKDPSRLPRACRNCSTSAAAVGPCSLAAREHGPMVSPLSPMRWSVDQRLLSRPPPTIRVASATTRCRRLSPLIPAGMENKFQ
jgi:hypothetical protein